LKIKSLWLFSCKDFSLVQHRPIIAANGFNIPINYQEIPPLCFATLHTGCDDGENYVQIPGMARLFTPLLFTG